MTLYFPPNNAYKENLFPVEHNGKETKYADMGKGFLFNNNNQWLHTTIELNVFDISAFINEIVLLHFMSFCSVFPSFS